MSELVTTDVSDGVLVVSMERERKRNAIDRAMADALDAALNRLDDDPDLRVGILTGTTTVFSSGSDLSAGGDYMTERGGEYGIIRRERRKPLIAAVEGPALGGGFEIVLACDLVVAGRTATFGLPEVTIGAFPSSGGLFRAAQVLPLNLAREAILTGAPITADRAHAVGLVNIVTDPGAALDEARALAARIARNAPLAVQASLEVVNASMRRDEEAAWAATLAVGRGLAETEDMAEGIRAFLERRPPRWVGR